MSGLGDFNELLDLQDQARDELSGRAFFNGVSIVSERSKDFGSSVEEALAKAKGILVAIYTHSGKVTKPALLGPQISVTLSVDILEQTGINRGPAGTGKQATQIVIAVLSCLHGWRPGVAAEMLQGIEFGSVPDSSLLHLQVKFSTIIQLKSNANLREP
jgi:hypothetical protein